MGLQNISQIKKKFKNINFIIIFSKNAEFKVYSKKIKLKLNPIIT